MQKHVNVFTDGSCLGNPGPGGYGALLIYKEHKKELLRKQKRQSYFQNRIFTLTLNLNFADALPVSAFTLKEPIISNSSKAFG